MIRKILLGLVVAAALVALGAASIWNPPIGESWSSVPLSDKIVALTFDDGPNPPFTEELLAVLARENVRATFFMTGEHVTLHPETARRVVDAGHHVANHGWDETMLAFESTEYIRGSLARTDEALRKVGVEGPNDFRAARGMRGLQTAWILAKEGRRHYGATAHGWDWATQDPDEITETVLSGVEPGAIIVLHDGYDQADVADRSGTVEAVRRVITTLKEEGYRFVTAPELVALATSAKRR